MLFRSGLVFRPGGVKDSHPLTLQKLEISAGSTGHLARKGFSFKDPLCLYISTRIPYKTCDYLSFDSHLTGANCCFLPHFKLNDKK